MAEDDVISAMWHSLVPLTAMEDDVRAGTTVESALDLTFWNDRHGRMLEICDNNYAEAGMLVDHPPQRYQYVLSTEAVCWNQEEIMVQGYPEDEETFTDEEMQAAADVESSLFYHPAAGCSHHPPRQAALSIVVAAQVNHTRQDDVPAAPMMIYRAPETTVRENNPFKPRIISIGPYHYVQNEASLGPQKKIKDDFVKNILDMNKNVTWRTYSQEIKKAEARVGNYYDDSIDSRKLSSFLMSDACAILGLLGMLQRMKQELEANMGTQPALDQAKQEDAESEISYPFNSENTDNDSAKLWSIGNPINDIFVMGNQIPFFVIETVYGLAMGSLPEKVSTLRTQIVKHLHTSLNRYPTALSVNDKETYAFEYILHYCHMYFKPSDWPIDTDTSKPRDMQMRTDITLNEWYGATDLYQSGVNFKRIPKDSGGSLLDIKFDNGVLEIPTLVINKRTILLFKNIIVFERMIRSDRPPNYFRSYIRFMNELIVVPSDVALLARKNIIKSDLGKEEDVTSLFGEFMELLEGPAMFEMDTYFKDLYVRLNKYYSSPFNKWWADLKQKHLATPRVTVGLMVGIAILACTFIAAVYNVKGHSSRPRR